MEMLERRAGTKIKKLKKLKYHCPGIFRSVITPLYGTFLRVPSFFYKFFFYILAFVFLPVNIKINVKNDTGFKCQYYNPVY